MEKEYYINEHLVNEYEYLTALNSEKDKEKYKTILKYEGVYSNGIKNGKAKEYYINGILKFSGEYRNNLRIFGQEYNDREKLLFDGQYLNGQDGMDTLKNMIHIRY